MPRLQRRPERLGSATNLPPRPPPHEGRSSSPDTRGEFLNGGRSPPFPGRFTDLPRFVASVVPQHRRGRLLRLGVELVTLAKADTAIPAQEGVVVARGTKPFGLFEEV